MAPDIFFAPIDAFYVALRDFFTEIAELTALF
jgi:hypothetical protein